MFLKAGSPKSRGWQGHVPSETLKGRILPVLFQLLMGTLSFLLSLAHSHITPVFASVTTWPSLHVNQSLRHLLTRTPAILELRARPTAVRPHLN